MGFFDSVKKKFLGDESQVQKAPTGGRKLGSFGKAAGGHYVKSEHGVGYDASSYREAPRAPSGRVGSVEDFRSAPRGTSKANGFEGVKAAGKEVFDYVAPKAKAAGKWMQERGMELNGDLPKKGRKKSPGRVPRGSQPPGYDGNYDMFGVGGFGGGLGGGYEHEEREEAPRRRKKSRRRPAREERGEGGFADMNHIPDSMRDMF